MRATDVDEQIEARLAPLMWKAILDTTLADEGSDGLVDHRHLEKACLGAPFGRGWRC